MSKIKTGGLILAAIICLLAITWIIQGNHFFMYQFFGIKYADTDRKIYEQSASYNQGMVQELQNMRFDYEKQQMLKVKLLWHP